MNSHRWINFLKQILFALILSLVAGRSSLASVADMLATEAHAPCGELHQIGPTNYITNLSSFSLTAKFESHAAAILHGFRTVNAGAVKYLASDINGAKVWRGNNDDGNYRDKKTYFIPVRAGDTVEIAYCASETNGQMPMLGSVSLITDPAFAEVGHILFSNWVSRDTDQGEVSFDQGEVSFDVRRSRDTGGGVIKLNSTPDQNLHQNGSLTIYDKR